MPGLIFEQIWYMLIKRCVLTRKVSVITRVYGIMRNSRMFQGCLVIASMRNPRMFIYVTIHDKTNQIVHKIVFELRPPLPTTTFELLIL